MISRTSLTVLLLLLGTAKSTTYPATLAGCNAFAALFDNTCTGGVAAASINALTGETVTCTHDVGYCVAGTTGSCAWERKLCVTCTEETSKIYIRLQTNLLPNHCYSATAIAAMSYDNKVLFNKDVGSTLKTTVTTQAEVESTICSVGSFVSSSSLATDYE